MDISSNLWSHGGMVFNLSVEEIFMILSDSHIETVDYFTINSHRFAGGGKGIMDDTTTTK